MSATRRSWSSVQFSVMVQSFRCSFYAEIPPLEGIFLQYQEKMVSILSSLCKNCPCILKHLISHCATFLPVDALLSCGQPEASAEKWKNLKLKKNVYIFLIFLSFFVCIILLRLYLLIRKDKDDLP